MSLMNLSPGTAQRRPPAASPEHTISSLEGRLLRQLLGMLGDPPIRLQLWNGEAVAPPAATPLATFGIADRGALLRLIADPEMQLGEMYTVGRVTLVDGDLVAALQQVFQRQSRAVMSRGVAARVAKGLGRSRRNSVAGSRRNIHDHYDIGNDFYRLWLDPSLSYTCAYFPTPAATLLEAQIAKLDHVCRKLRLREGDELIEAGCGWGSLALHAASRYGARVRAYNISREQVALARERAQRAGLADRVEFIEDDYRNIRGTCDAFASVGMLEHVGPENYHELGRVIARTLRPSGCGLIHTIGRNTPQPINRWIRRRIFPGSYIPSLMEMMEIFEPAGMSVLDVENLRPHYARTLQLWLAAFERERATVQKMFDERFVRMWRLYLAGSQAGFQAGHMQLFQVVFAPAQNTQIAWTREHLYPHNQAEQKWTAATS